MKISLVGTYASAEAVGLRFISSLLKSKGHDVQLILMTAKRNKKAATTYPQTIIDQFIPLVRDSQLIGLSLMTNTYYHARELTLAIKNAGITAPVVWGGVHPTVAPDTCIDHTDIVCIGEGEGPMVDLAHAVETNQDYTHIPNLWVKTPTGLVKNDVRPLLEDLDQLPFPDYDLQAGHYVVHKDKIVPATPKNMRNTLIRYRLLTTRGCPYACAFCCNSSWIKIYRGKGPWVRKRSIENVIAELESIKNRFPSVNSMTISDDTFFVRDEKEFEKFAELYKSKIGWPFEINTHPATINEQKIKILQACGCSIVKMGIQSGSQKTNYEIFNRRVPNQTVVQAMGTLNQFSSIQKEYHYIVNNPFEPESQFTETLHFAAEHHADNSKFLIFPLALFPGSQLHQRAAEEGIISPNQTEIFERVFAGKAKRRFDKLGYNTMLLQAVVNLRTKKIPSKLLHGFIDFMLATPVRFCLDTKPFKLAIVGIYLFGRSINKTLYQLFVRPFRKKQPRYA
ncbi:MAG: B12-binding domain-containing radical SAM protein [Phycisphaerae bacterium]|nr:B12-binding domain-containing radical SAM protein [Phycisphaerae bacterium]